MTPTLEPDSGRGLWLSRSVLTLVRGHGPAPFPRPPFLYYNRSLDYCTPASLGASQLFVESFNLLCLAGRASQVAQWVKNLPAVQEMLEIRVRFLGQEDPLATHASILA